MTNSMQIGVFVLDKEEVFRNTYETAAWYEDVKVQSGEYPVFAQIKHTDLTPKMSPGQIMDTSVGCRLDGFVVGSDFSSLFHGSVITPKVDEKVGQESSHYLSRYAHSVAQSILESDNPRFRLNDDFHARKTFYIHKGELRNSYGIYHKATDYAWQVQQHMNDDKIVQYAYIPEGKNDISVLGFWDDSYVVGTFDSEANTFNEVVRFSLDENDDSFWEARKVYLSL